MVNDAQPTDKAVEGSRVQNACTPRAT